MIENNVALVYQIQKSILADLTCKVPGLSTIICFTDGCAGRYKNKKKFIFVSKRAILD